MNRFRRNGHWGGWFYDETWKGNVEIIWPVDLAKIKAYIKLEHAIDFKSDDDSFGAKVVELRKTNSDCNLICLRWWSKSPTAFERAMLAHEIFHVAEHVLSRSGVNLTADTTETYAYLIESITRRCYTLLDTKRKVVV